MSIVPEKGRARAGKYSTLAVCGFTEGVIQAIPVAGTLTAELVTEIIENQVLPLLPRNSFLVADNASVHSEVALCRILARKNITLVKVPAYSYDLDPIEMVFGLVKAIIARFSPYVGNYKCIQTSSPYKRQKFLQKIVGCFRINSLSNRKTIKT